MNQPPVYMHFLLGLLVILTAACNGETPALPEPETALQCYWNESWEGPMGVQVREMTVDGRPQARMLLGGKPLYTTGVNCYDLFLQSVGSADMDRDRMRQTVDVLIREKVPVVRFSVRPYTAGSLSVWADRKEAFLANLDTLARWCDKAHIALVPSIFWNTATVPEYCGEAPDAWGDVSSKTYAHMLAYTEDIVGVLKKHKSVIMWEFGNEFNLSADIGIAGHPQIPANAVATAYKGFAGKVAALDGEGRCIATGNSIMRNAQYHLMTEKNWNTDSYDQYKQMTDLLTPAPMTGMSEHLYEEARIFSDKGTLSREDQVRCAMEVAAALGKVYYVGEFTSPHPGGGITPTRQHLRVYYEQRVQLSMMWNFCLSGQVEGSFSADDAYGSVAFTLIRQYNEKFKTLTE